MKGCRGVPRPLLPPLSLRSSPGSPARARLLIPFVLVVVSQIFEAASEILRKLAADTTRAAAAPDLLPAWTGVAALLTPWTWAAIAAGLVAFALWLWALRRLALSLAFLLASVVHVFVAAGSWWILGEKLSAGRVAGIALIILGLCVVARTAAAEERAEVPNPGK